MKSIDDLEHIPLTVKQDLRDSEGDAPPFGDYRFTDPRECVRLGTSTGTTGTPTITLWTRHDIWLEYESAARTWWRIGYRPGMIATHAHPAYLYGGGIMLSGAYEYFGLLNIWVPPPDTDELAEQGLRFWMRVKPDVPFMGFSTGRFFEVASQARHRAQGRGAGVQGHARLRHGQGHAAHDRGRRVLRLPRRPVRRSCRARTCTRTGRSCRPSTPPPARRCPTASGATSSSPRSTATTACCATTSRRRRAILREPCPCGETTIRGLWGGRFKDLLASQGKRFQVTELEGALRKIPEINEPTLEYVVVKPTVDDAPLVLRVECAHVRRRRRRCAARCAAAVREQLGIAADVEVLARDSLPRSGYKASRVVDA